MTISITPLAVLFDADGVLQQPPTDWQAQLVRMAGASEHAQAFMADVFAAEGPCLTGKGDFRTALAELLARWNSPCSVEEALEVWTRIEVDHEALAVVAELRTAGIRCYLTTNQQPQRARHMSEVLGYAARFDQQFYSCQVGHMKPSAEYFRAVMDAIRLPPSRVLFIDDHPGNVDAARAMGIQGSVFPYSGGAQLLRCELQAFGVRCV